MIDTLTEWLNASSAERERAVQDAVERLRARGASIRSIDIVGMLSKLCEANDTVMYHEGAISIPLPVREGIPLGLPLTAAHGQDALLLANAVRVHASLGGVS